MRNSLKNCSLLQKIIGIRVGIEGALEHELPRKMDPLQKERHGHHVDRLIALYNGNNPSTRPDDVLILVHVRVRIVPVENIIDAIFETELVKLRLEWIPVIDDIISTHLLAIRRRLV